MRADGADRDKFQPVEIFFELHAEFEHSVVFFVMMPINHNMVHITLSIFIQQSKDAVEHFGAGAIEIDQVKINSDFTL